MKAKRLWSLLLLPLLAGLAGGAAPAAARSQWAGELDLGGTRRIVALRVTADGARLTGELSFPFTGDASIAVTGRAASASMTLVWSSPAPARFEGRISGSTLAGPVRQDGRRGRMILARVVDPPPGDRLAGFHETAPGQLLSVTDWPFGPVLVDYASGRAAQLYFDGAGYFRGPAFSVPAPVGARFTPRRNGDGALVGLDWHDGRRVGFARRIAFREIPLSFENAGVRLSGTLVLPPGPGPHPAMVRIAGYGAQTRRNLMDGLYAYHGIAYFSFDKRGTGDSGGDWRTASLLDLARDVTAALAMLRRRPEIDGAQIGLEGNSEGGWVAPLTAALDGRIALIVLRAGPALNYVDELLYETETRLEARGMNGQALADALAFRAGLLAMLRDGRGLTDAGWAEIHAYAARFATQPWFPLVRPEAQRSWRHEQVFHLAQVQTAHLWARLDMPVLALYGAADVNVPAERNAAALIGARGARGGLDVVTLARTNHEGLIDGPGGPEGEARAVRYAPDYFRRQLCWVARHVRRPRAERLPPLDCAGL